MPHPTINLDVIYQDKFRMEYKRVKKEIVGTYTFFQGMPLLQIIDLEKVTKTQKSEIRGIGNSSKVPPLMELGPREGIASHIPQMSGIGGHPITRTKCSTCITRYYSSCFRQFGTHGYKTNDIITTKESQTGKFLEMGKKV